MAFSCCGFDSAEAESIEVLGVTDTEADDLNPLYEEDEQDIARLLLVSTNLPQSSMLVQAALPSTDVIHVQYEDWTLDKLREVIVEKCGEPHKQYMSLGLLDHGKSGEFCLLRCVADGAINLQDMKSSEELKDFFQFLASYVQAPEEMGEWRHSLQCRIDLLACCVAADSGIDLIEYLEDLTEVNWAASTNKTGAGDDVEGGFDWIMESEEGLGSVHLMYFQEDKIKSWKHSASWYSAATGAISQAGGAVYQVGATTGGAAYQVGAATGGVVNQVASTAVQVAGDVSKPVAQAVGVGVGCVAGNCRLGVHNDFALPILINFTARGGGWKEITRKVLPGKIGKSSEMPCMGGAVMTAAWVSLDGDTWFYHDMCATWGNDGAVQKVGAQTVVKGGKSQKFVGFSAGQALEDLKGIVAKFVNEAADFAREAAEREINKLKKNMPDIKAYLEDLKPEHKVTKKPKRAKTGTPVKVKANDPFSSKDGFTIFESYYDEELTQDSEGHLHQQMHTLRTNFEDVRYLLIDIHHFWDTVKEAANTPKELKESCTLITKSLESVQNMARLLKLGSGGPFCKIAEGVKRAMLILIDYLEKAIKKTADVMERMEKPMEKIKKEADSAQAKMKMHAPWAKMVKANHRLATLENSTLKLAKEWPECKALPEIKKDTVGNVDRAIKKISDDIQTLNEQISPHTREARVASGMLELVDQVVEKKTKTLGMIRPVQVTMKKVTEFLDTIIEKTIKKILALPIVKDIFERLGVFGDLMDWTIKKILEITQLDKAMDYVAQKVNPFAALEKLEEQLQFKIPDLDSIPNILQFADRLEMIKVVELSAKPFSAGSKCKGIYLPIKG